LGRAACLARDEAAQIDAALADLLERGRSDPAFVSGADEDVHSFVERMLGRAAGRRRAPAAHRPLAQRTGVARSSVVPARRILLLQRSVAAVVEALAAQAHRPATR
jgi:argininosuccinate lyase